MIAEARYFYVVLFGGLEDREIVIDLEGFIVDEDLYLLGGERGEGAEYGPENGWTHQHGYLSIFI